MTEAPCTHVLDESDLNTERPVHRTKCKLCGIPLFVGNTFALVRFLRAGADAIDALSELYNLSGEPQFEALYHLMHTAQDTVFDGLITTLPVREQRLVCLALGMGESQTDEMIAQVKARAAERAPEGTQGTQRPPSHAN